ncbi:hypothetical protein J2W56_004481 [Nocardia kruczakiae]|uniref:Uncharacterized protein n=1 Tax=Nocardia kruczakiae TaxID=261477 RepID=A0ABU1XJK0_9NOCA|nr:hypothetical protein [Nocardia kruczakiae]
MLVPGGAAAPGGSVDVLGALTATLGLGAAVFAVVRAPEVGAAAGIAVPAAALGWATFRSPARERVPAGA